MEDSPVKASNETSQGEFTDRFVEAAGEYMLSVTFPEMGIH